MRVHLESATEPSYASYARDLERIDRLASSVFSSVDERSTMLSARLESLVGRLAGCEDRIRNLPACGQSVTLNARPTMPRLYRHTHPLGPLAVTEESRPFTAATASEEWWTMPNYAPYTGQLGPASSSGVQAGPHPPPTAKKPPPQLETSAESTDLHAQISEDVQQLRRLLADLSAGTRDMNEFVYRVADSDSLPPLPVFSDHPSPVSPVAAVVASTSHVSVDRQVAPLSADPVKVETPAAPPPPPPPQPPASNLKQPPPTRNPLETPARVETPPPERNALLDAIKRAGGTASLKKASQRPPAPRKPPSATPAPDIMSALSHALSLRRRGLSTKQPTSTANLETTTASSSPNNIASNDEDEEEDWKE